MYNLFTTIFHCNPKKYIFDIFKYLTLTAVSTAICLGIISLIKIESLVVTLIVNLVICVIIPNVIFFVVFRNKSEFKALVSMMNTLTKGKIKLLKRWM